MQCYLHFVIHQPGKSTVKFPASGYKNDSCTLTDKGVKLKRKKNSGKENKQVWNDRTEETILKNAHGTKYAM